MENVCNFPFGKLFQIMEILRASERQQRVKNPEDLFPMKDIDNQRIWAESRAQYSSPYPVDIKDCG